MKIQIAIALSVITLAGLSCASKKQSKLTVENQFDPRVPTEQVAMLKIETGACFGACPIETYTVYANGAFQYHPEKYGTYPNDTLIQLNNLELNTLYEISDTICTGEFDAKYPIGKLQIADLPKTILEVNKGECAYRTELIHPDDNQKEAFNDLVTKKETILSLLKNRLKVKQSEE